MLSVPEVVKEIRWSLLRALNFRVNPFQVDTVWLTITERTDDVLRIRVGCGHSRRDSTTALTGHLPYLVRADQVDGSLDDVLLALAPMACSPYAMLKLGTLPDEWRDEAGDLQRERDEDAIVWGTHAFADMAEVDRRNAARDAGEVVL